MTTLGRSGLLSTVLLAVASLGAAAAGETVQVIDHVDIHWNADAPEVVEEDGFVVRHRGQSIVTTVDLPPRPESADEQRRIVARVTVEALESIQQGRMLPNDLWTRLGAIWISVPGEGEVEVMRFVTGYGAGGVFEQDVTTLAPLLHGRQTIRAHLGSYSERPGWNLSVELEYDPDGVGQRRPLIARPIFEDRHVTAADNTLSRIVTVPGVVPGGVATPRIRILTTGHCTDGIGAHEFASATHVLKIDGVEVIRWRPWSELGGTLRDRNPFSGQWTIDGREIWSSDLDRSGWHPGLVVEPEIIPLPELTPGLHTIELEIEGIRPLGDPIPPDPDAPVGTPPKRPHGYWVVSAVLVADQIWPTTGP